MGLLKFTKSYSASDDGSTITGSELGVIQSDLSAILNAGLSNANIATDAAIAESKLAFSTTGHTHNGTDANYALIKHYRRGMQVEYASATTVTILPGVLDVGGKLFITTTSTTLDITTGFMGGQAEPADGPAYVYAYNNSGAIGFKFSTSVPEISDSSSNTAEFPLRYHNDATLGKCRLIGIVHNRTDISADMCNNFDLSNFACGSFVGDGADEIIYTGWTPNFIWTITNKDNAPADTDIVTQSALVQRYGFITANPQPKDLLYALYAPDAAGVAMRNQTSANATANSFYNINAQTTSQVGSFTIDAASSGIITTWFAWTHGMGSL